MYRWYQKAKVCYAFLSDVEFPSSSYDPDDPPSSDWLSSASPELLSSFRNSLWFTRGWTLQELLAPRSVNFYDRSWVFIGSKDYLRSVIAEVTKIKKYVLNGSKSVFDCPIAERMLWAAHRKTTRVEDRAYSLLGLFNVNMPMLYGEGEKAFTRLQEEIIRHSNDQSIFAWTIPTPYERKHYGLLAPSPEYFFDAMDIRPDLSKNIQSVYTVTNKGLSINLELMPWAADTYLAVLECVKLWPYIPKKEVRNLGIFLRRLAHDDQYVRVSDGDCSMILFNNVARKGPQLVRNVTVHVKQDHVFKEISPIAAAKQLIPRRLLDTVWRRIYGYRLEISWANHSMGQFPYDSIEVPSSTFWGPETRTMRMKDGGDGTVGFINLEDLDVDLRKIKLAFDFEHAPLLSISGKSGSARLAIESSDCLVNDEKLADISDSGSSCGYIEVSQSNWIIRGSRVDGFRAAFSSSSRAKGSLLMIQVCRDLFQDAMVWRLQIDGIVPPRTSAPSPGTSM
ncbi:HET-domain-containing protein [Xylaria arbuscula]|nr:HET-domain-containing protein [Xylaria arbuscula]